MVYALQIALQQLQLRLSAHYVNLLHTSACLSAGGARPKTYKQKPSGGKRGNKGRAVPGSSRRRLETFSKSRPPSSHLRDKQVVTAPRSKTFGLKRSSPLYKLAEAEAQEARDLRREEQERNIAEKRRAREEHAAEKHRHYEHSLSYQSYIERQDKRSHRPTPSEQTLPRSKVGELTVTERPASHAIEKLPQSFSSPPLSPALLKGVREILGSHRPSPIQALSLKYLFRPTEDSGVRATSTCGEHILASETGSGKTIAYLLPILQHLKVTEAPRGATHTAHAPRALVLAPTHELTRQLSKVAKSLVHAEGAKLRILCSSKKNNPSSGIGKSSMKLTARKLKYITEGEIKINRDDADFIKQGHAVDMLFTTPMRALEMVKGRGWDRVERNDLSLAETQGSLSEDNLATVESLANENTNVRDRRGKLPESTKEAPPSMKYPREMELGNVEWIVVDEADVLFDPDFRQYTELLLSEISAARSRETVWQPAPSKAEGPIQYPFHLTLTSATIPLSLSSYLSDRHPRITYLTSPNLHKLPRKLKIEHANWTSGNHNSDVETKLREIWSTAEGSGEKVLIFANKNSKVQELGEWLDSKGVKNVAMTSQSSLREYGSNKHIESFLAKPGQSRSHSSATRDDSFEPAVPVVSPEPGSEPRVLITTSLLSRGLDFAPSIGHVFILDSPRNMIDFLHRAGRTARAGRAGRVILFQRESGRGSADSKKLKTNVRKLF